MSCKRLFKVGALSLLCLGAAVSSQAYAAGAASANLAVSAVVQSSCTIITTPLTFPAYTSAAEVDTTATVSISCTNLAPYVLALDKGIGAGSTTTVRVLTSPSKSAVLNYGLYTDDTHDTNWGNTTDTVGGTGDGTSHDITIYGKIPGGQTMAPAAADYADTVAVTVTY